jgi:hypothetical protein
MQAAPRFRCFFSSSPPFDSSGSTIRCAFLQRNCLIRFDSILSYVPPFRSQISRRVFDVVRVTKTATWPPPPPTECKGTSSQRPPRPPVPVSSSSSSTSAAQPSSSQGTSSSTSSVTRALALYKYVAPNQRADLMLACRSAFPPLPSPTPLQRHASAPDFVLSTFPNLFLFYYTYLRKSHFELLNLLSGKFVCN